VLLPPVGEPPVVVPPLEVFERPFVESSLEQADQAANASSIGNSAVTEDRLLIENLVG
jgi:hypothetical protein